MHIISKPASSEGQSYSYLPCRLRNTVFTTGLHYHRGWIKWNAMPNWNVDWLRWTRAGAHRLAQMNYSVPQA